MASLLTERCCRSTPRGVLTAHAWWLCQCETGACQYHWCSIYGGLERVGSWVPGGSVGGHQLAMAAKVRRHWFNPCRLGSRGHLGANFSLLLYTDLIKKRKPSKYNNYYDCFGAVMWSGSPSCCEGSFPMLRTSLLVGTCLQMNYTGGGGGGGGLQKVKCSYQFIL